MIIIYLNSTDKYSALVSGEASEHVEQFILQEYSFDDYTQVITILSYILLF